MNSPGPLPPVDPDAPRHIVTSTAWFEVAACVFLYAVTDNAMWHFLALILIVGSVVTGHGERRLTERITP